MEDNVRSKFGDACAKLFHKAAKAATRKGTNGVNGYLRDLKELNERAF